MADYYPLIARAIAGLDPSAPGEARRALYERARSALIAQLRSVQPPLSESEITRERLSLEEAVRKVESEAAQRAREASRSGPRAGDAFRAGTPRAKPGEPPARARQPAAPQQRSPRPEPPAPKSDLNPQPLPPAAPPRQSQPPVGMQDPALPPTRERSGAPRRPDNAPPPAAPLPDQAQSPGVRGFRDIAADADDLGRAAAQANRSARKTYANVPSPSPEFDRLEPSMENRGADPDVPYSYDESAEEAARWTPPPDQPGPRPRPKPEKGRKVPRGPLGGGSFPFKSAIAIGIVLILAGAAILWGPALVSLVRTMLKPSAVVEVPKDTATPAPRPKIADRVGQPSSETVAPVAQRVVLYDEDPADPKGKQYVGTVVWRTEQIKGTGTAAGDLAVRADIDIPERKFKMTMSFRRNTDSSLPASHTAELTFILPQNFDGGGVGNVPGILMKSNEQARGTPLAGLAVKVTDGFFLVGLSNVEADRARNLQLLKERSWFDIPLVYANQRRAIIAIEKGAPGERAFQDAFAAWGE
ncbi:hypothetical protein [uncultured Bradyrhizobium sp.]|uniref:hypothetical protein n=1 Tax=uncultured Bradyrhizobium sp. TaxID=199684 RepID=UPI0035CA1301